MYFEKALGTRLHKQVVHELHCDSVQCTINNLLGQPPFRIASVHCLCVLTLSSSGTRAGIHPH